MKNITYFIIGGRILHGSKTGKSVPNSSQQPYSDKIKLTPTLRYGLDLANLQNDTDQNGRRTFYDFAPDFIHE